MATVTVSDVASKRLQPDFETIFRRHWRLIYRTAFSITGNPEDAEDVLQTVFVRLLRSEFPPDLDRDPRAYLYRAAVNAALDTLRLRRRQILTDNAEALEAARPIRGVSIDKRQAQLLEAISTLKPKAVEILLLKYVHNYKEADIANMLGTTRGAIALSLFRSRARIRKLMLAASGGRP